MSADRDTPRGPTSQQLRRRALAHEQARDAAAFSSLPALPAPNPARCDYCGNTSPIGCEHAPCSFHARA